MRYLLISWSLSLCLSCVLFLWQLLSSSLITGFEEFNYVMWFSSCFFCWTSWICGYIGFTKFGEMLASSSSNIFSILSLPNSVTLIIHILGCLKLSYSSLCSIHFSKTIFPLCILLNSSYCCVFKFTNSFFINAWLPFYTTLLY